MGEKLPFVWHMAQQIPWQQYLELLLRIVVAGACGAAIGYERSRRSKDAGIRTHIIVCSAAAIMMIVSKYAFLDATAVGEFVNGARGADPARVAAQVVSGISFIGAGVIFKNGNTVKGLTTAAGIWATAGIGLAIGAGMYGVGIFSTLAIAVMQLLMHKFRVSTEAMYATSLKFRMEDDPDFRDRLFEDVASWKGTVDEISVSSEKDGVTEYSVVVKVPNNFDSARFVRYLGDNEKVISYSVSPLT